MAGTRGLTVRRRWRVCGLVLGAAERMGTGAGCVPTLCTPTRSLLQGLRLGLLSLDLVVVGGEAAHSNQCVCAYPFTHHTSSHSSLQA